MIWGFSPHDRFEEKFDQHRVITPVSALLYNIIPSCSMGNFLETLQGQEIPQSKLSIFRQYSLSNIQESNGKFRYLCDTFAIDESEFVEIFGESLEIFRIFDDDDNLLIDGLELFTGLILFTENCKFQDKIKFIFNIYDFNEMNSLSKTDLEFLFISCCAACNKIMGIKSKLKQDEIMLLVNSLFPDKKRVNINEMLKWATTSKQILTLFQIVEQKPKPLPEIEKIYQQKVYIRNNVPTFEQNLLKEEKKEWLGNIIKRTKNMNEYPSQVQYSDIKMEIEHVIGFRSHDLKHSLLHIAIDGKNYLLYSSACVVVIYLIGSSYQEFYAEHKNEIISICNHNDIVASGEFGAVPYIHIWDLKTRKTLRVIAGTHRKGIHILKFVEDGKKLIACGLGEETSPIYIYNTSDYGLERSVSIGFPIVELTQINQFKVVEDQKPRYLIGTTHSCYILSNNMEEIMVKRNTSFSCFQLIHLNSRRKSLRYYEENDPGIRILLAGTQDGVFGAYNIDKKNAKIFEKKYDSEIIKIEFMKEYIVVATFSSAIELFDYNFNLFHTLDITSLGIKLFNYNVIDFILYQESIILSTGGGEVIRLEENKERQLEYRVEKIKTMISLRGEQNAATIVRNEKKEILYIGGSEGVIMGVDLSSYEIVDIWRLNQIITALDVITFNSKNYLSAGTKHGMIYLRVNLQQMEKSFKFRKQITDLKFIIRKNKELSLLATSINGKIYVLDNIATSNLTSRHKLEIENQIPISIHAENERIIINTENNNLYLLSLVDKKHREIKESDAECTIGSHSMRLSYHNKQLLKHDLVVCPKVIAVAGTTGGITVWRDKESFFLNKKFALNHHKSKVNCVLISKSLNHLITIGKKDGVIIIYRILFSEIPSIYNQEMVIEKPIIQYDQIIDKEIEYCIYSNNLMSENKDQHLLIKGLKHSELTTFLNSLMEKWSENSQEEPSRGTPPVNLKLNYVYGLQSYERRNNLICIENPKRYLFYVSKIVVVQHPFQNTQEFYLGHRFKVTSLCLIDSETVASGESASLPTIHIWNYHNLSTIRIIETHFKYGILNLISSNNNLIVCGLENKVTFDDRETPSYGFSIYNIREGTCTATRSEGLQKIYSISSNQISPNEFCTTGSRIVNFWEIKDKSIQKVSECFCSEIITASIYYHYALNNNYKSDLIVGTYSGSIGVVVNKNKFIILKERAHGKFINCIRWIKIGGKGQNDLFVTSSEDETIKVWNKYFECLFDQDIKKIEDYKEMFKVTVDKKIIDKYNFDHNLSIQSISYWNKEENSNEIQFLLCTRNGEVLQFNYDLGEENGRMSLCSRNHSSQIPENSNKRVFFAAHPKYDIMVTIGEDLNLFIWDTDKNKLISSKFLGYIALPTCIQFNSQGDILAIGFSDGLVILYDCKINRPNMAKSEQKYLTPTLNQLQKNKSDKKSAVLNIEFSESGEYLAVSYDNCYSNSNLNHHSNSNFYSHSESHSNKTFIESSYIVIYISLLANKYLKKQLTTKPNDKVYSEFHRIPLEEAGTLYETQQNNKYGMAAYYLTYLESYIESEKSDKKTYLLIYYQIFDSKQVRINHLTETKYILWDIDACSVVISLQPLNQINWRKLNFPNSLSCRYQLYQSENDEDITKITRNRSNKLQNNNLLKADMTAMITLSSRKNLNDYMILGSLNGDLHIASTYSIEFENGVGEEYLAKTIPAHSSFINHIDIDPSQRYLFSSGLQDQVILKWKIIHEPKVRHITKESVKFFKDQPKPHEFQSLLAQYKERDEIHLQQFPRVINHKIQPYRVIGRRTTGVRSKVFYNESDKIVYSVGPNILVYDNSKAHLSMIPGSINGSIDEISSMMISENGRFCLTTTAGTHASLSIWEINSQMMLEKIILFDIVYPLFVRLSSNNKRVLLYGLDQKLKGMIMLIDVETKHILGRMKIMHADSSSIRDGGFIKNSINKFIICGSNHLTLWEYEGKEIVYQNLEVEIDRDLSDKYVFLCYLAIENKFITGCHDGYLHLWSDDGKFITKESGHTELCENIVSNGKYILSTGRDLKLIVWNIESNRFSKDYVFSIKDYLIKEISQVHPVDDTFEFKKAKIWDQNDQILSIFMKGNKLLLDTKYGSIYEFYFEEARLNQITTCTQVLNLNNRNKVVGMFFTKDGRYLYYMTNKGVLSIWDIEAFKCVEQKHFERETIDMVFCEDTDFYFICFEAEVFVLEVGKEPMENIFLSKNQIKAVAVGKRINQPMIAIAEKEEDYCRILVYYYIKGTDKPSKTTQIHRERNKLQVKNSISMSFSPKGEELLIMIDGKDFAMPLIEQQKKQAMGEKESPKYIFKNDPRTEKIIQMYKDDKNPILDIQEISPNLFLVGDTIGTLRLFEINSEKEPKLVDYSLAHMNEISKIRVSHDRRIVSTYSKVDESIIVWKMEGLS